MVMMVLMKAMMTIKMISTMPIKMLLLIMMTVTIT